MSKKVKLRQRTSPFIAGKEGKHRQGNRALNYIGLIGAAGFKGRAGMNALK